MAKKPIYEELSGKIVDSEKFKETYGELLKLQYIGTRYEANLSLEEIKFLLQCASIFAFVNDECKQLAYKIATILSERYSEEYDLINRIVQYIIINSGQLPVVQKNIDDGNVDYFSVYRDSGIPFNPTLFKNIIFKQVMNKIPQKFEEKDVFLTDFQSESFHDLEKGKSISLSAPTSAGKSFLLKAYLAGRFKEKTKFNGVYIVPTRALISQVQNDFKRGLRDFEVEEVLISSSANYSKERTVQKKLFVLTQERFHNLLFDTDFDEPLDVLIIDEAQKVSDGSRGIILEEVIEEAIKRNEKKEFPLQKIFLSPFSKNPEKFAAMFRLKDLQSEKTKLSPVSQNLLKLDIDEKSFTLNLATAELDHEIKISEGKITEEEISELFESKEWPLLWATRKFAAEFNIIYCNSTKKCVEYALLFENSMPDHHDDEIEEAVLRKVTSIS
jgi:DEAD/DEAH box helicase